MKVLIVILIFALVALIVIDVIVLKKVTAFSKVKRKECRYVGENGIKAELDHREKELGKFVNEKITRTEKAQAFKELSLIFRIKSDLERYESEEKARRAEEARRAEAEKIEKQALKADLEQLRIEEQAKLKAEVAEAIEKAEPKKKKKTAPKAEGE